MGLHPVSCQAPQHRQGRRRRDGRYRTGKTTTQGRTQQNYGRADLDKHRLGELIDLIGSLQLADFGGENADTFRRDLHPDLLANFVLANPPFNDSDWFRKDDDVRWQFGVPPKGNANFAWVQHFVHHLAPNGLAGFVLANGSMGSNQSGEGDIRKALIDADLVKRFNHLGQLLIDRPQRAFHRVR